VLVVYLNIIVKRESVRSFGGDSVKFSFLESEASQRVSILKVHFLVLAVVFLLVD
jgi:hypothetical protein